MRNPLSKALWSISLAVLGAGLVLLASIFHIQLGKTVAALLLIAGMSSTSIFLFTFLWALVSAIGYARLIAGKGVIARWHVSADEWDRFRAFDRSRAAERLSLRNDMRIRDKRLPHGVDVVVGRRSIIDGSYHSIAGQALGGRQINWLNAPVDPECIEFPKSYPRSRGGSVELTLRVPVPAYARAEGVLVFEYYCPRK